MTVIARFEVIPVREGSMSTTIAHALRTLDRHPVSYQTTATDTIIEAETVEQLFGAIQAAHQSIPEDRVITSVEIDEDRRRRQNMDQRVASVTRALGHPPARRYQPAPPQQQSAPPQQQPAQGPPAGGAHLQPTPPQSNR
jgi:uncharacterized protein YqgV (UPF0045/DUF77 family)